VTVLRQVRPERTAAEARVVVHGATGLLHGYAFGKLRLDGASERRVLAAMTLSALIPDPKE
jgi:hydrogenase/urease accessory protein HupE